MRMLRLSTSDEIQRLAGDRAAQIVERRLAEAVGQPVETVVRRPWPDERLPGLLQRWMERESPDFVFLKINGYWFNYESVPLRLERRLGRLARPLASVGRRSAEIGWLARQRPYRFLRRFLLGVIGGDTYFATDEVIQRMEQCIRLVLQKEDVLLVVRSSEGRTYTQLPPKSAARYAARLSKVNGALRQVCESLHVPYLGEGTVLDEAQVQEKLGADRFHRGTEGNEIAGSEEAEAFIKLWRAAQAATASHSIGA